MIMSREHEKMKVVIFSGTTEGRLLSGRLAAAGISADVFVATQYGGEAQGKTSGVCVHVGRKSAEKMRTAVAGANLCIDATHPYAEEATKNICWACREANVPYYRLKRPESKLFHAAENGRPAVVASAGEAAKWLRERKGNILLAIGAKELAQFAGLGAERLYPRVLPFHESLKACEMAGIPHRNIIAMQGPFGQRLNEALICQYHIDYLVTKDGGKAGGFMEKLDAAAVCGIQTVVIARPDDAGYSIDEIYEICRRMA